VRRYHPDALQPGEVQDTDGETIGRHAGVANYTIGQRKGLGIAMGRPMYVASIDCDRNVVTLGDREALLGRGLRARGAKWLASTPTRTFRAHVKVRYRHRQAAAAITPLGDDGFEVVFDEPQFAITPGQAAVIYDGDVVMGGGWIETALAQDARRG
jgi:tRNA-specific 2-thiouridylase